MATKIKRIEDLSEEELNKRSGEMYDKIMPSPEPGEQKPLKKMAKGGTASSRADGCATKGKTRGKVL
jgi:hypothetical protein